MREHHDQSIRDAVMVPQNELATTLARALGPSGNPLAKGLDQTSDVGRRFSKLRDRILSYATGSLNSLTCPVKHDRYRPYLITDEDFHGKRILSGAFPFEF